MANFRDPLYIEDAGIFRALNYDYIPDGDSIPEDIAEREAAGFQGVIAPMCHQPIPRRICG
jgi:hypothetical protein